jgi:3-oxoacyl-(acyl-carrier-protein) synthase
MDPSRSTTAVDAPRVAVAECALVAQATFQARSIDLPALRKAPNPSDGQTVHPSLLRHADPQTVIGLAAVLRAIGEARLDPDGFSDWGVLVAPRYLGREAFELAFPTFQKEGAWGISPHLIPAHSLHSPSGTISQALKAHGPNLGVGGTPGTGLDALLCASTWLRTGIASGVWVVLTGREGSGEDAGFEASALALTMADPDFAGPRLRVAPGEVRTIGLADTEASSIGRWLVPGVLRLDAARSPGPIPNPHFRKRREGRDDG